jgi:predicted SnoaL-like aldol condensation-catalyzing enzyme
VRPIHVIVEGDFGISHSKYHLDCTDGFFSDNVDLFRMENGKIAEEWDVYNWDQIVPEEERANSNTYFGQAPVTSTVDCSFSAKAKEVAMGFMQGTFYGGVDINKYKAAADKYYAPQYIEHNPYTPNENGREDFKSTMEFVLPANPNMKWEMQKVIADGNYVAFISRVWYDSMAGGDNRGLAIVDIYRVNPETMLIEEHWDIDMEIPDPAESANANGVWSLGGAYSTGTSSDF